MDAAEPPALMHPNDTLSEPTGIRLGRLCDRGAPGAVGVTESTQDKANLVQARNLETYTDLRYDCGLYVLWPFWTCSRDMPSTMGHLRRRAALRRMLGRRFLSWPLDTPGCPWSSACWPLPSAVTRDSRRSHSRYPQTRQAVLGQRQPPQSTRLLRTRPDLLQDLINNRLDHQNVVRLLVSVSWPSVSEDPAAYVRDLEPFHALELQLGRLQPDRLIPFSCFRRTEHLPRLSGLNI